MEAVKFMNELRRITSQRVKELEQDRLRQECKIKLNGNISYKKRYEEVYRSIVRAKELNEEVLKNILK
jgi:hypothetical protein